jgi:hypothetical protein
MTEGAVVPTRARDERDYDERGDVDPNSRTHH